MNIETLKLFNKVSFDLGEQSTDEKLIEALNLEVGVTGYSLGPDLMVALRTLGADAFAAVRATLLQQLKEISGSNISFVRLFNDFPYSTPDQHDYMERRILGQFASENNIRLGGNLITALSCGHVIDSALFDIDAFGGCPICQYSVTELASPDISTYPFKSITPLKLIGYSNDGFVTEANVLLARQSSLSDDEKKVVMQVASANTTSMVIPDTIFKETLPLVYRVFGADAIKGKLSGATDVMRIAYALSADDADLSLKENVKFKLTTSERRNMLVLLEGLRGQTLAEDMMRNRERWLRLGEKLKPTKYAERFPNVAMAFHDLRNNHKRIPTFNKAMESVIRSRTVDQAFVDQMATRPGEFARKIDFMLREAADPQIVITGLEKIVAGLTDKLLLELRKYFRSRDRLAQRMFVPKGQINKVQIVPDNRQAIPSVVIDAVCDICTNELLSRYSKKSSLGKVWIDPALRDVLMPFNRRGDTSAVGSIATKGSRFPFTGDVIRGFVWWKNGETRVDVDLSIVTFDKNFNNLGHVAYTCLRGAGMQHSGDITDAPNGASEFIDMDVNVVRQSGVRYVALSVISYTGQPFNSFESFAGFMERDALRSGKVYEPESVALRFDISSATKQHMPVIFDLVDRKVIYADMSLSTVGSCANVAGTIDKQAALTEAMLSLPERKPTLHDIAYLNAKARGTIVKDRGDADTVYAIEDVATLIEGIA